VDGKGEDELVFETVPVLVEVWELGTVFDIWDVLVLDSDSLVLLVLVVVFVEVFEAVVDNVGKTKFISKFLLWFGAIIKFGINLLVLVPIINSVMLVMLLFINWFLFIFITLLSRVIAKIIFVHISYIIY
jgi:hypothetical protein